MNIIIAFLILSAYTIAVCCANKEIPSSLSASVFYMPKWGKLIWVVVIAAVVFLVAPAMIDCAGEKWQFLAFLACAGLIFVAGAPLIKDKTDIAYKVHCGGAILCAVSAQVLVAIIQPLLLITWAFWLFTWTFFRIDRGGWRTQVFWAEMVCFTTTFAMVLLS